MAPRMADEGDLRQGVIRREDRGHVNKGTTKCGELTSESEHGGDLEGGTTKHGRPGVRWGEVVQDPSGHVVQTHTGLCGRRA